MRIPVLVSVVLAAFFALCSGPLAQAQQEDAKTTKEITELLVDFLTHNEQRAVHDRFWAPDLIYTSSAGKVSKKPDIMKSMDADNDAKTASDKGPKATYAAEDIVVRAYGNMAALTFRLVANNPDGNKAYYRNSGTFLRRNGKWQAVTWQATKATATD